MMTRATKGKRRAAGLAIGFGLLTILSGGAALRGMADMGAVVPFVLLFNFGAGFAYVLAGALLWRNSRWAFPLALALFLSTAGVFAAFGLRVAQGGAFELRTVWAMTLRCLFWGGMAWVARPARAEVQPASPRR
jgi:hypothetical protein